MHFQKSIQHESCRARQATLNSYVKPPIWCTTMGVVAAGGIEFLPQQPILTGFAPGGKLFGVYGLQACWRTRDKHVAPEGLRAWGGPYKFMLYKFVTIFM